MKRTKSLFALLVATVLALALVPGVGFAADGTHGEMYGDTPYDSSAAAGEGSITIAKTKANETYTIYRLFDLASFNDADPASGAHSSGTEAYSYVIRQYSTGTNVNPWWDFLVNHGVDEGATKYAVVGDSSGAVGTNQYFWIEPEAITLTGPDGVSHTDYHVVIATSNFLNAWDAATTDTDTTFDYAKQDYVNPGNGKESIQIVQDFAQAALAYAEKNAVTPNYIERGKQNSDGNTPADTIVVNDATTVDGGADTGSPASGKVYLGWYLMGTTTGTLVSLDTTNKDVTIYDKNETPELAKSVFKKGGVAIDGLSDMTEAYLTGDAADDDWVANTDADIADYVMFRTVITAQQGADKYKLHDSMEKGLQFVDGTAVTNTVSDEYMSNNNAWPTSTYTTRVFLVRGSGTSAEKHEINRTQTVQGDSKTNWTLAKAEFGQNLNDGCDFEIEFKDAKVDSEIDHEVNFYDTNDALLDVKDGDKIVILYWAYVTNDAVVFGTESGDNPGSITGNNQTQIKDNQAQPVNLIENDGNTATAQKYVLTDLNNRNTNSTILTYGERSHTAWQSAEVTTYQYDIVKTQAGTPTFKLLNGAKFRIYKANTTETKMAANDTNFINATIGNNGFKPSSSGATYYQEGRALSFKKDESANSYRYNGDVVTSTAEDKGNNTIVVSDFDEPIRVYGLEEGYYLVVEEEAPEGYNKLAHPIVIYINGDVNSDGNNDNLEGKIDFLTTLNNGSTSGGIGTNHVANLAAVVLPTSESVSATNPATYSTESNGGIHIINQTGQELPSTGGLGTKAFYAIGGSLFAASVIFLLTKKRLKQAA